MQIRDIAKAETHRYAGERLALVSPGMPSRIRRLAVIAAYLLGAFRLFFVVGAFVDVWRAFRLYASRNDRCAAGEMLLLDGMGLGWLAVSAVHHPGLARAASSGADCNGPLS